MAVEMASRTADPKARYDIGALEQRVFGLEKQLNDISSSIAALGAKLDERSRTPWVTLIAAGGFLLAFMTTIGVLAYGPIEKGLTRQQSVIDQMETRYVQDLKDENKLLRSK
jgi:hypothetical protein